MNYWFVKEEPEAHSWSDFLKDGKTAWTSVRNFPAWKSLRAMKSGGRVFFYQNGGEKSVVGLARIAREFYPDPPARMKARRQTMATGQPLTSRRSKRWPNR